MNTNVPIMSKYAKWAKWYDGKNDVFALEAACRRIAATLIKNNISSYQIYAFRPRTSTEILILISLEAIYHTLSQMVQSGKSEGCRQIAVQRQPWARAIFQHRSPADSDIRV